MILFCCNFSDSSDEVAEEDVNEEKDREGEQGADGGKELEEERDCVREGGNDHIADTQENGKDCYYSLLISYLSLFSSHRDILFS